MAMVSVGMPVLNGAATIERALDDLQAQTFGDIEILVCDNASEDDTSSLAEARAELDPRIKVIRFEERVDILHSFKRALEQATAPYFMFAPADDCWYPTFIEQTVGVLEGDPSLAACTGRVAFTLEHRFNHIAPDTFPLDGTAAQNIAAYLRHSARNCRAFSLYRRTALVGAFPPREYHGWDYQMIARSLVHGRHQEIPKVLAERDATTYEAYLKQIDRLCSNPISRLFPLLRLAFEVMRDGAIQKSPRLVLVLAKLVIASHLNYSLFRLPRWYGILIRVPGMSHLVYR